MSESHVVYFDHAATTPLDQRVLEMMTPYLTAEYGNASSLYSLGRRALLAVDQARKTVAETLGCSPGEITFVSCGSESDNLALRGVVSASKGKGSHLITTTIEHHAVLHTCHALERQGCSVTYLPVDHYGRVSPNDVDRAITEQTILVSVMYANNEIGTIEPVAEIGAICRKKGVLFHVDAVGAGGMLLLDVENLNCDLLSLSAHKFYGPKGAGILYVRQGVRVHPQLLGGAQEKGRRAGTENVAGIVGTAAAFRLAQEELSQTTSHVIALRDRLIAGVLASTPRSQLTGHPTQRLANSASFCFEGVDGGAIILLLDKEGIAASTGSACTSGSVEPSHVLEALGVPSDRIHGSLRLTLGRGNSEAEIDLALSVLSEIIGRIRSLGTI